MVLSKQFTRHKVTTLVITCVILVSAIACISYYFGYQRNIGTVKAMEREQYIRDEEYSKGLKNLREENAEIATMNTIVCAEYQNLYQAYNKLYTATSTATTERYIIPGSARGQTDPCYGEMGIE